MCLLVVVYLLHGKFDFNVTLYMYVPHIRRFMSWMAVHSIVVHML